MKYVLSLFFVVLLFGCKEVNSNDENKLRKFVEQWNESHTLLKSPYLAPNYMNVVSYYGKQRTRAQVMQDKKMLFEQFPDYTQSILNDDIEVTEESGIYLVTFTTHVSYNGIEADYDSYLSVTIKNGDFRILREGVAETVNDLDAPIFPKARENNRIIANKRQLFGDFNGDGLSDYATVISPELIASKTTEGQNSDAIKCKGGCDSIIVFSSADLENITIKGAYKSELDNLKDLNRDGADEIGFWDIKPTSKTLYVFNPTNGALLTEPIFINTTVHKGLKLIDVFKKSGVNKITVTRSVEQDGKWALKSQIIMLD
ncbi:hypothetical protein ES711_15385 [Gelidibacter salicanalis]|uniref:Uncharacterized protein n=1 Tax=Gelidibacter salicanalis TaxID=291193 RepID=A0A5C7AB96_9FLAO|nr:hypothetical protein [Gelidibacter salicanalis]TXE05681.1 hypothetical protein ES711_15385 [Gelidibacter salicanalis]